MMGTTARSNAVFSSCSEGGERVKLAAEKHKTEGATKRKDAAMEALKTAASTATINQTYDKIKTIPGCDEAVPDDNCLEIIRVLAGQSRLILDYRN